MATELKPCPFCGEQPTQERIEPHKHEFSFMPDYPGAWIINCGTCEFRLFSHESITDVESKWNRRMARCVLSWVFSSDESSAGANDEQ